ncbi:hypothetical protein Q7C36_002908 [Tachysurus vachellii]|uniref:DDE Tnp4 domain-containing protein n=1 Tax=Tachysurus vachellii TaxID=175792 RepID=A0AA88NUK8_TACVA|nr:hypothetical protein Q7C36_002908 [Tachysurus vachellii]
MADVAVQFILVALQTYFLIQKKLIHRVRAARSSLYKWRVQSRIKILGTLCPRSEHWWDTIVPDFTPLLFLLNFGVSPETFEYICSRMKHVMERRNTNYRLFVPIQKRVAIAIWKLATGGEYKTISHLFGVGLSTVFNCVQEFCNAVITMLPPYHIRFPDADKLLEMSTFFNNRWRVPQCVGAIDGTHIPIIAREDRPQDYYNRKGWHSVVLQAVVDGKGLLWDVCVGYPGSVHDARVLRQSHLWEVLSDGELLGQTKVTISGYDVGYYLTGDPAYPMQKWLMKPFSDTGRLTPEQHTYNYRLSSARLVLELCKKMALTCCVLHNICEEHGDNFTEEHTNRTENIQPPVQAIPEHGNTEGADTRAALMMHINRGVIY